MLVSHVLTGYYFNPLLPCGRRLRTDNLVEPDVGISIHSSRAGGDRQGEHTTAPTGYFNPLLPCGRRLDPRGPKPSPLGFQSTPPVREETSRVISTVCRQIFQSTPPVREETRQRPPRRCASGISIHSSRAGGDPSETDGTEPVYDFNPLLPCGRRRQLQLRPPRDRAISIHSSRAGGDAGVAQDRPRWRAISIHSSRAGGDGMFWAMSNATRIFQSTPPVREETRTPSRRRGR